MRFCREMRRRPAWLCAVFLCVAGCQYPGRSASAADRSRASLEVRVTDRHGEPPAGEVLVEINGKYAGVTRNGRCEIQIHGGGPARVVLRSCVSEVILRMYPETYLSPGQKEVLIATSHPLWWAGRQRPNPLMANLAD